MNTFKDKRGFTLIELLAVIVVLAIISVLASRTILTYLGTAKKDAFAIEVNEAISAASDAVSLIQLGSITDTSNYKYDSTSASGYTYCFTLNNLNALGLYDKDLTGYSGVIKVLINSSGFGYTYTAYMTDGESYYVNGVSSASGDDTDGNVLSGTTMTASC